MKPYENELDFVHPDEGLRGLAAFQDMQVNIKHKQLSELQKSNKKDYCFELRLLIDLVETIPIESTKRYLINLEKRMRHENNRY